MHGWYSDSSYWNCWEQQFQLNGWIWQNTERGYGYIAPSEPSWNLTNDGITDQKHKKLVICHSLGIHLLPSSIIKKASHIILLNSFSRFIPYGKESRAMKIALEGMQKQIGREGESKMLFKFAKKANIPIRKEECLPTNFNARLSVEGREKLKKDLDLLIKTSKLPSGFNKQAKVLVVNGKNDAIVCQSTKAQLIEELRNYLDNDPIDWVIEGEEHFMELSNIISDVINWLESD